MTIPDKTTAPPWWETAQEPTRQEMAYWLAVTSDENRDWWFDERKADRNAAAECFEHDHASQIAFLQASNNALRDRLAWLEKHWAAAAPKPPRRRPDMTNWSVKS